MLIIGLTGPSGAGKGEVGRIISLAGIPILDADVIYHELLLPPSSLLNELTERFGTEILSPDGTLDRKKLGEIVFSDKEALGDLNALSHKYVLEVFRNQIAKYRKEHAEAVVLDAPQLFESHADEMCHVTVSVLAEKELRLKRICQRDGIDEAHAEKRIAAQKSDAFFRQNSDYIIENDGDLAKLKQDTEKLLSDLGVTRT